MNINDTWRFVDQVWDDSIVPRLMEYIRIPAKSPAFDPDWEQHGYIEDALNLAIEWCKKVPLKGMEIHIVRLEGRTPLLYINVPGDIEQTVLLYGHLDKQPEMSGWADDLGPWQPVIKQGRLYGRGGADDGYAVFASLTAIHALQEQGIPHANCKLMIETCEESGSYDLPYYVQALKEEIGQPDLVVCLDSGAGNYDQLWCTTSLRGLVGGTLSVDVLVEGVHSGDASGVVPSGFRIMRQLLSRLEDEQTGRILPPELHAPIPEQRRQQAAHAAQVLGDTVWERFPFDDGVQPVDASIDQLVLNRTWLPALEVIGAAGIPDLEAAGNVMRPSTALKLSLRLPPTVDADRATEVLKRLFERDAPCNAHVRFKPDWGASGWEAPPVATWLERALEAGSRHYFEAPCVFMGEGGTIPFMGMLGEAFPDAQFVITGVLGPHSNAHGPNEFLHIATAKKLTCCVAEILEKHYLHHTTSPDSEDFVPESGPTADYFGTSKPWQNKW